MSRAMVLFASCLLLVGPVEAQRAPHAPHAPRPAAVGMQVRLLPRAGAEHRGTIARRTTDSIFVHECVGCDAQAYALDDLAALEFWHSHTSIVSTLAGAVVGTAAGGALGVAVASRGPGRCDGPCGLGQALGALVGGMIGLVAGTGVGFAHGTHGHWEPLALPAR